MWAAVAFGSAVLRADRRSPISFTLVVESDGLIWTS